MQHLLFILIFSLLLFFLRYILLFLSLCKSRLQYGSFQLQKSDLVPAYLKQLFQIPIAELESFGFKFSGYLCVKPMLILTPPQNWEVLLYNKAEKTHAKVGINRPLEPVNLFEIEFYTFFTDGSILYTMNGKAQGVVGEVPNTTLQDAFAVQQSEQWERHRDTLRQFAPEKVPCDLAPEAAVGSIQDLQTAYIDRLARDGAIAPVEGTPAFRFQPRAAFQLTRQFLKNNSKVAKIIKQRQQQAKTDPTIKVEIPVELEVEGFLRAEEANRGLIDRKFRTGMMLGSLALFIVFATQSFASYSFIIFVGVLCLHEGGHLLAMKLFGYRDTTVLFVPFLGALATARPREDATLWQKFWVLLAGPLPGLILGLILALAMPRFTDVPHWLGGAAWMLIGLNLFNLLPIYPLDGGQIADILVFSRVPYLGVIFKGAGVIILALLGLEQPLLLVFAALIALTIPNSFRSAKTMAKLRVELRQTPFNNRETLLVSIFQQLKRLGYHHLPFSTRYIIAKDLVQRQHDFHSKGLMRLGLILLYGSSLLGGAAGTLAAAMPGFHRTLPLIFASPEQRRAHYKQARRQLREGEIARATAALRANPSDLEAYRQRAQAKMALGDRVGAQADYDRAVSLAPQDVRAWLARARFYEQVKNAQSAYSDYTQALRLAPQKVEIYRRRARVRTRLGDLRGAISDCNAVIKLDPKNAGSYILRSEARQKFGDFQGAIADYNFALQLEPKNPEIYALRGELYRQLGNEAGALADEQKAEQLDAEQEKEN